MTGISDMALILRCFVYSESGAVGTLQGTVIRLGDRSPVGRKVRKFARRASLLVCIAIPRVAFAQDAEVVTPVDLFEAEQGEGKRVAPALIAYGNVETQLYYDSNVYNSEFNKLSDGVYTVKPSLKLQTDFARHMVELIGSAEIARHFDIKPENSEQFDILGRGRLDLGQRYSFAAVAGYASKIERRGTAGDVFDTDKPVEYDEKFAGVEFSRTGAILELFVAANIRSQKFDDATIGGVPIDLSYRDNVTRSAMVRFDYELSPKIKAFTEITGNQVNYDIDLPVSRDSSGFGILTGIKYEVSALVDVEVAAGYLHQNFDDPAVASAKGINYRVRANWTPTPKWKLTAEGGRAVDPSPLTNVPSIIRSDFSIRAQRVLSDRFLVEANAGYVNEDYRGLNRTDDRFGAGLAIKMRVSERIGASAFTSYRKQSSPAFSQSYDGVSAGVSVNVML